MYWSSECNSDCEVLLGSFSSSLPDDCSLLRIHGRTNKWDRPHLELWSSQNIQRGGKKNTFFPLCYRFALLQIMWRCGSSWSAWCPGVSCTPSWWPTPRPWSPTSTRRPRSTRARSLMGDSELHKIKFTLGKLASWVEQGCDLYELTRRSFHLQGSLQISPNRFDTVTVIGTWQKWIP